MQIRYFFLFGILITAVLLRLWQLEEHPVGFTPDEASFGYDAYSLLKTGKDQWGQSWPLVLRSFGDFKAPLYAYLTIPSVAIFGLNEFAVRLPNALLGTLAILVTYLMASELFKGTPAVGFTVERHSSLRLLAALLIAISPWHISLSRGAFEANLTTFFMPFGVWAFLKGVYSPRWMVVGALVFGLNLFSYHSAKVITPILIIALLWWKRRELGLVNYTSIHMNVWKYKWAVVFFVIFFSAMMYTMVTGGGARGSDIAIFNPTGGWDAVADRRYEAVQNGLPDGIARLFSNKATYVFDIFQKNYIPYLSSVFFFTQGAGEATYGMIPGVGVLYLFELPFVLITLWVLLKNRPASLLFLVVWILISPIPAALTKGPGYAANRAAVMIPALQILSAYGAVVLYQLIENILKPKWKKILLLVYIFIGFISVMSFLETYYYHGPRILASSMLYGREETISKIIPLEDNFENIIISRSLSEPHIFVAFYKKWDPQDYQKEAQKWLEYERKNLLFVDQLGEYNLGKYIFRDIHFDADSQLTKTLLVGRKNNFPLEVNSQFTVEFPNHDTAIKAVGQKNNE